jgi:hypothetical protein
VWLLLGACSGTSPGGSGSIGSSTLGATPDATAPLVGVWDTGHLTESQMSRAFPAAGGTKRLGAEFYSQFGAQRFVVISMHFMSDGRFFETESADGGAAHEGYLATYRVDGDSIRLASANPGDACTSTYAFEIVDDMLRLHDLHPCDGPSAVYNAVLFATFPFSRR